MFKKSWFALFVLVILASACAGKKEYTDNELSEYAEILTQLYLVQGYENSKMREGGDTIVIDKFDTDTIYEMYGTSQVEFQKAYKDLQGYPEPFKKTYEFVNENLDSLQSYLKRNGRLDYRLPLPTKFILSFKDSTISSDASMLE